MAERIFITRDVLEQNRLKQAEVEVPEWGGFVLVRELTSAEIEEVRKLAGKSYNSGELDAVAVGQFERLLVARGWINEDGSRVLKDSESDLLAGQSANVISRVSMEISTLSGLRADAAAAAKKN